MKKKTIAQHTVGLALLCAAATGFWGWHNERKQVAALRGEVTQLQLQEKKSAVVRSVSQQMEEIAYEQKLISDEQREEAIKQKHEADIAKELADQQKREALRQKHEADEAKDLAERNSQEALRQKQEAEQQRRVADEKTAEASKLNYLSLGRLLGTKALTLFQAGNHDVATILAYAAYKFTSENGSEKDIYDPSVLKALMLTSQSVSMYRVHSGPLTALEFYHNSDSTIVTVSAYGEIFRHTKQGEKLKTEKLFSNKDFDFRSVYINAGDTIFAISRSGQLVTIDSKQQQIIETDPLVDNPYAISILGSNIIAAIGKQEVGLIDLHTCETLSVLPFAHPFTATGRLNAHPLLFDNHGNVFEITGTGKSDIVSTKLPAEVKGTVTAYAYSQNNRMSAYGMLDGTIFVVDDSGKVKQLIGHRSRISRLKFNGSRLYSVSYDGIMNLWMYENEKIDPLELFNSNSWILFFTSDASKDYMWTGDQNGKLTATLVSVPEMVTRIEKQLRNFTQEEWNYYIGSEYPYESFTNQAAKKK